MTTIRLPRKAIINTLDKRGWAQGKWGDLTAGADGPVCLHGAIRICTPVAGDAYLIEKVWERRGHGTGWNDRTDVTEQVVRDYVLAAAPITDDELDDTFGPSWRRVVWIVRTISAATPNQIAALDAASDAAFAAASAAAFDAARDAAFAAAYAAAFAAARDAAFAAAFDAAYAAAFGAARAAAFAAALDAAVHDLIGQHSYTQAHSDLLTGPFTAVFGDYPGDDQ